MGKKMEQDRVHSAMRQLSATPAGDPPSAHYIWWKAQRLARRTAEERALSLMTRLHVALGTAVGLGAAVWLAAAAVDLWLPLTACGVALLAAAFGMRAVRAEE